MFYISILVLLLVINLWLNFKQEKLVKSLLAENKNLKYEVDRNKSFRVEVENNLTQALKACGEDRYQELMEELERNRNEQSFPTALDLSITLKNILSKKV